MPPRGRRVQQDNPILEAVKPERRDQVWEAVKVFRGLIPKLTKFARAATGNQKVTIEITSEIPRQNGNKIYLRPPLGLASREPHRRSLCGQRDDTGTQICRACQIREVIDFYLFHEIAHIIGKTQSIVTRKSIDLAYDWVEEYHNPHCEHYSNLMYRLGGISSGGSDSMYLGNLLHKYIMMIVNVLEDARVNELTFRNRVGMRKIFEMNIERLLTEGTEIGIDQYLTWAEAPLDEQFIIGLQLLAAGYQFDTCFHPSVVETLRDETLGKICAEATSGADSVHDIFRLALEVFNRAQELGYCVLEPCEDPTKPPPLGPPGDESGEDDGQSEGAGGDESERGDSGTGAEDSDPEADGSGIQPGGDSGDSGTGEDASTSPTAEQRDRDDSEEGGGSTGDGSDDSDSEAGSSGGSNESGNPSDVEDDRESASDDREPAEGDRGSAGDDSSTEDGTSESDGDGREASGQSSKTESGDRGSKGDDPEEGSGDSEAGSESGGNNADEGSGDPGAESDAGRDGRAQEGGELDDSPTDQVSEAGSPVRPGTVGESAESPDDAVSSDQQADSSDNAGISGIGSEGVGTRARVGGSSEELAHEPGQEQVDAGPDHVQSATQSGLDTESSERNDSVGEDSDESGDPDDAERSAAEGREAEDDYDLAPDDTDPWSVDNPEYMPPTDTSLEAPSGPIDRPTAVPPQYGDPDDIAASLARFLMHSDDADGRDILSAMADGDLNDVLEVDYESLIGSYILQLVDLAIQQVGIFDAPSVEVAATEIATYPHVGIRWDAATASQMLRVPMADLPRLFAPDERLIGQALLHARTVFDDNKRSRKDRNRRSGKVNTRVLARRAPVGDDRLFQKKIIPGKKDYFLVLGGDASASTKSSRRSEKIKRSIHALADLLSRLGVDWAGYMHSAFRSPLAPFSPTGRSGSPFYNYMLPFKSTNEAWNDVTKTKLASCMPVSDNLDGHSFEFYRKIAMESRATERIVVYYTDGQMPLANYVEELAILTREIDEYRKAGIHLVCVGIQTDSPAEYGLPCVRVDSDEDLIKVVKFIENLLTR